MAGITRAELDAIEARLQAVESRAASLEVRADASEKNVEIHQKLLVIGNGEPSLKEISRMIARWLDDNKDIPVLVRAHEEWFKENKGLVERVNTQGRWIETANRIGWLIAGSTIGLLVLGVVSLAVYFIRITAP